MSWQSSVTAAQRAAARSPVTRMLATKLGNFCRGVLRFHLEIPFTIEGSGELLLVQQLAPRVKRFVDVGANVGDWAQAMLDLAPGSSGLLLEPSGNALARLESRFGEDRRVHIVRAAAGAAEAELEFYEEPDAGLTSSLVQGASRSHAAARRVPVVTVDGVLAKHGWDRIDVLKIDTEGYDDFVLAGAGRAISERRIGVIQFEYNSPWRDAGATLKRASRRLTDAGYALYMLRPEGLFAVGDRYGEFFFLANFVAVAPEWHDAVAPLFRGEF